MSWTPDRRLFLASAAAAGLAACGENKAAPAPAQPGWRQGADAPFASQEVYPTLWNGGAVLAGGMAKPIGAAELSQVSSAAFYDPNADKWTPLADLPAQRHHLNLLVHKDMLLCAGGFEAQSRERFWAPKADMWFRDTLDGPWKPFRPMPALLGETVAVSYDGRLHFASGRKPVASGGGFRDLHDTDKHFYWDGKYWEDAAPVPTARNSAAGAAIDGKLYVVGGRVWPFSKTNNDPQVTGNLNVVERYDVESDSWETLRPLPKPMGGHGAAALGGKLYVFGGEEFDGEAHALSDAFVYDPATDVWEAIDPMPRPRHGFNAVAFEERGEIALIGGAQKPGGEETLTAVDILKV